jgi:deoxyribodipyrimidine photolyase-related protein
MNHEVTVIFPHQLFKKHPALSEKRVVWMIEETLFFHQVAFHKQKLILHRASMKAYADWLTSKGFIVEYLAAAAGPACDIRKFIQLLAKKGIQEVHIADPTDEWLLKRIKYSCEKNKIRLHCYANPNFINTPEEIDDYFSNKKQYFQTDFYINQRKKRNILLNGSNQPLGGKWSFDADNRKKFPKNTPEPGQPFPSGNLYVAEAITYVEEHFPDNPGKAGNPFGNHPHFYPVTHTEAERWLQLFLEERFALFGVYEDAMVKETSILHHSVLTPMLNIGLLDPGSIIQNALEIATRQNIPLNSLEGFIRQILGWREFIRAVYQRENITQRTRNYWGFKRKIPASFWTGTTGIVPVDTVIKRVLKSGYAHHIERLMVLGNFMLLCEFDPDEVYRWFMEMFVDAYDWVMVPNVYGMTQFADGGIMTTKPYISGSNYIMKMSDYEKGDWQQIWDGLFWRFMHVHRHFFLGNPRLGMLVKTFDKLKEEKKQEHLHHATQFLRSIS